MKAHNTMPFRIALPLPAFVLHPITVHVYLAAGHLSRLFGGEVEWAHMWKGCGALAGAYVFQHRARIARGCSTQSSA